MIASTRDSVLEILFEHEVKSVSIEGLSHFTILQSNANIIKSIKAIKFKNSFSFEQTESLPVSSYAPNRWNTLMSYLIKF